MSSRRSRSSAGVLGALALAVLVAPACGRKGDPIPPPPVIPARTNDLSVQQTGSEITLEMSYPRTTAAGMPLPGIRSLEIWEYRKPVFQSDIDQAIAGPPADESATMLEGEPADPMEGDDLEDEDVAEEDLDGPEEELGLTELDAGDASTRRSEREMRKRLNDLLEVRDQEFQGGARLGLELSPAELDSATVGGKLVFRFPLPDPLVVEVERGVEAATPSSPDDASPVDAVAAADDEGTEAVATRKDLRRELLAFAVVTVGSNGKESGFSNKATLLPEPVPPPPTDLALTPGPHGIQLDWQFSPEPGSPEIKGFHVYRRPAQSASYGPALQFVPSSARSYVDRSAAYETRYIYAVAAVVSTQPVVESSIASEQEISFRDVFPPAAPTGLISLGEAGRVRLLWEASAATDVTGYLVFRSTGDEEPIALTEAPLAALEYSDQAVVAGSTYRYTVRAVDAVGNVSDDSEPSSARVP